MNFSEYKPKKELADKYEKIGEWCCDECGFDQVYIGDGRMVCGELDCESLFGNNDTQEHMTGSYADMNDLDGHQVEERISEFDSRLFNLIMSGDGEKKIEDLIDSYKGAWAYATTDQLIEELEQIYRDGVLGFTHMDYHEILTLWNEYQDDEGDKKDYGDRI
jgi:hypothetical protein